MVAPVKKKQRKEEEEAEEVKPQTWQSKASETLPELLQDAAKARTSAIKLDTVEYAGELSKQLLEHAATLEKYYQKLRQSLDQKKEDKVLKALLKEIDEASAFSAKAQAGR